LVTCWISLEVLVDLLISGEPIIIPASPTTLFPLTIGKRYPLVSHALGVRHKPLRPRRETSGQGLSSNRCVPSSAQTFLVTKTREKGVCAAVFALCCMILWLAQPRANYYLIFGLPVSRVYTSVSEERGSQNALLITSPRRCSTLLSAVQN
jgi:hypothetical protein